MNIAGYLRRSKAEPKGVNGNGLGLEAQRSAIEAVSAQRGWDVTWFIDDGHTAANIRRPALTKALHRLENRDFEALVVSRLDRLSRSTADFADLLERGRQEGWSVVTLDLGVDTTTPVGELVAGVLIQFAQYERRLISLRTKEALAEARKQGTTLGRPITIPSKVVNRITRLRANGHSLRAIAGRLNTDGIPTAQGGAQWHPSTVAAILASRSRQ